MNHKSIFLTKFEPAIERGEIKSICDLGSGESLNFLPILRKYPDLTYVGVEPSKSAAGKARENLRSFASARVYTSDGYSPVGDMWGRFDLVISLSVLEHVKQLERFITNSVSAVRKGGQIVHRYDLGHALHPSSAKERLQIWLGNNLPFLLPEHKFVSFLDPDVVTRLLEGAHAKVENVTYHQMPDHKRFLRHFRARDEKSEELMRKIVEWEFDVSEYIDDLSKGERLKLFPTIALWGIKK